MLIDEKRDKENVRNWKTMFSSRPNHVTPSRSRGRRLQRDVTAANGGGNTVGNTVVSMLLQSLVVCACVVEKKPSAMHVGTATIESPSTVGDACVVLSRETGYGERRDDRHDATMPQGPAEQLAPPEFNHTGQL